MGSIFFYSYSLVHKSEVIKNTLNPTWRPFQVPIQKIAINNADANLKIEVYDWDSDSKYFLKISINNLFIYTITKFCIYRDDLIGIFTTTFSKLSSEPGQQNSYEVVLMTIYLIF